MTDPNYNRVLAVTAILATSAVAKLSDQRSSPPTQHTP